MHRRPDRKGLRKGPGHRLFAPLLIGFGFFAASPTPTDFADMGSYIAALEKGQGRWKTHLTAAPAGAVQTADLAFVDPILTNSTTGGGGITLPSGEVIAFSGKVGADDPRPDSERITRSQKKGRVVTVAPIAPPRQFSAGSVLERQSNLLRPTLELNKPMAFVDPDIKGREVQVARAFYARKPKVVDPQVSPMLAKLVTNRDADILATAYAPPPPDYSRQSPFASILQTETRRGRFIPPIGERDHAWAASPLPASAFSAKQQRCLAAGIYFEARGESLKGQAAVAQVILNRVRNPTYPDSICGVVYQNQSWRNRCQFSFACDGIRDRIKSPRHWNMAEEIAIAVSAGKIWLTEVGSSTHYHATYVRPPWARKMRRVGRIGQHIFFVTHGGGWS
ncbi:cell wall hydrolase [Pseudohoeflea coraliihabitans]|uniref:Cell wall hydrolase n=1 Tax=Pseudohoeflea coraliihabitans TaxID=2860393 RepID=A0ABS6WM01_9HYPH|nr:cell wall hydrolase [Pseudohoeflea sp. DP4N28-3]MBW3096983.1 cell wall hydrolase [Pseudohoeflea sp. DP4N28-3]